MDKLTRRKFFVIAITVMLLMVSTISVAYANAGRSKAEFGATAAVLGIGAGQIFDPGADFSTKVKVKYKGRGANRHIDRIVVKTKDEGVLGGFTAIHPGCVESGDPGACDATDTLIDGQTILSLHHSRATLRLLAAPFDLGGFGRLLRIFRGQITRRIFHRERHWHREVEHCRYRYLRMFQCLRRSSTQRCSLHQTRGRIRSDQCLRSDRSVGRGHRHFQDQGETR